MYSVPVFVLLFLYPRTCYMHIHIFMYVIQACGAGRLARLYNHDVNDGMATAPPPPRACVCRWRHGRPPTSTGRVPSSSFARPTDDMLDSPVRCLQCTRSLFELEDVGDEC